MTNDNQSSRAARFGGLALAAAGAAHFVAPQIFERLVVSAFPRDTRKHVYANGAMETAIGLGLAVPTTRKFAAVGLLAYGTYLGTNAARSQRRPAP